MRSSIFATGGAICNHSPMTKLANLDRVVHQKLRVRDDVAQSVCRGISMCAASLGEIPRLVVEYPLAFTKNPETGEFVCVVLFGVDPTQNLFWRDDRWNSDVIPLNVARQPFAVTTAGAEGNASLVTCIDVENPGVQQDAGELLFDEQGKETPYLRYKLSVLAELVEGEQAGRRFAARLAELGLIRPIQLEIKAPGAEPRKISGLHSIDEPKLRALDGATLAELNANGYLHAMYSMLSSLTHLQILARRSAMSGKAAH
jgi:hypothetical protein